MSEFKIASTNYTDNNFLAAKKNEDGSYNVEGKVVFENKVTTPDGDFATKADLAGKQDKLTASTGINLNGSTISVNTASTVGTSNLPVTSAAVNTKLSNYVNSVSSPDGSITVTKSGSSVTLKANGGSSGNYVPLGSYGSSSKPAGALPIGLYSTASAYNSTASGFYCVASGDCSTASGHNSTASGDYSVALGLSSTASGSSSIASGESSTASGFSSIALGYYSTASGTSGVALGRFSVASGDVSIALGRYSTASGALAQTFGSYGRNANYCCTVIAATNGSVNDCGETINYVTQLYLIPKGSPLAVQYEDGEACLGYVTVDENWNKIASGTKKLSELLNNNVNTFEPRLTVE